MLLRVKRMLPAVCPIVFFPRTQQYAGYLSVSALAMYGSWRGGGVEEEAYRRTFWRMFAVTALTTTAPRNKDGTTLPKCSAASAAGGALWVADVPVVRHSLC